MVEKRFYLSRESYDDKEKQDLNISFSNVYDDFESHYNLFYEGLFDENEFYIPVSIFSSEMGSFQAIVRYLKDHEGLRYSKIAKLTNRDQRTIWNVYKQSENQWFNVEESRFSIPLSVIANRKNSVLANLIIYLKSQNLSFNEIATLLKRNYQTIYTTHRKTRGGKNEQ
ncbi:MAG: hypothetical protein ABH828_03435 [archaeon]